jgi:hypothetical protein
MRRTLIVAALAMLAFAASALAAGSIRGTAGDDTIAGTTAADSIFARAGDDTVNAAAGDDRAHGGRGVDKLNGEDGNDWLKGGGNKDEMSGGGGDDVLDGRGDGRAADKITCGDGTDTVRASRNDEVADDCENVTQPGAAKGDKPSAGEPPFDADDKPGQGPKGDDQPPFDEDGKAGNGPKPEPTALAAADAPTPTAADLARDGCKGEKQGMGAKVFKLTYAAKSTSRAMAACVAKATPVAATEKQNAAQECKAERDADPAAFAAKYGSNKNKKNALGKCVSGKAQEATEAETEDRVNAAKTCKAERDADSAAFTAKYGTNKNKKNAFGKCVSATAKADDDEQA